jgi:hypothetical protein
MGKFEGDFVNEFEEYGEDFREEIYEELDAIREEREGLEERLASRSLEYEKRFKEEKEKTGPFLPDPIEGFEDVSKLVERIDELERKEQKLRCKENDSRMMEDIQEIKEEHPYWGKRFESDLKQIREDEKDRNQRRREHEERGEDYLDSDPSPAGRKIRLSTRIEMAKGGLTPDRIGEVVDDYDGSLESGWEYWEKKEKLSELFNEISNEEAESILEKGRQSGKYSDANYYSLKRMIRQHYGR